MSTQDRLPRDQLLAFQPQTMLKEKEKEHISLNAFIQIHLPYEVIWTGFCHHLTPRGTRCDDLSCICIGTTHHIIQPYFLTQQNRITPLGFQHVYSCSDYFELCLSEATTLRKKKKNVTSKVYTWLGFRIRAFLGSFSCCFPRREGMAEGGSSGARQ